MSWSRLSISQVARDVFWVRHPWSILYGRPEPGLQVRECSTNHCWKQWHTTDTLCPTCAAIHRYVHPASRKPKNVTLFKWLKLFNGNTYSSAMHGCTLEWQLQKLFTFQSTSYCLQSQNRGHKDRPPERHLIANDHDKWITNTTIP